jgi:TonB family protein
MANEAGSAGEARVYQQTANDRFKRASNQWFFSSIVLATGLHFGLFQFFPELTASDVSFGVHDFTAIELPPEVDIPPPPEQISRPAVPVVAAAELQEDITIAPTTFEENPVENLPPPPADVSRVGERPVFTPYTVKPEIKDRERAKQIMLQHYPKILQDAGIGGTVHVWVFIDTVGHVQNAQVQVSSGNAALDQAALESVYEFEFTPALNMDKLVEVWVALPVTFHVPE